MKPRFQVPSALRFGQASSGAATPGYPVIDRWVVAGILTGMAIVTGYSMPSFAGPRRVQLTQALPTPVPPTPYASSNAAGPEQYLVVVNGNSDLLLQEVRQLDPSAFVSFVENRSVIQVGRFSSLQNAQGRVRALADLGIGAQIQPVAPAIAPATIPTTGNVPGNASANLPPIPVAATPASVEFGQAPPFQTAAPAAAPPPPGSPSVTGTPQLSRSGYYVVVPSRSASLSTVAGQVLELGAAPSLVQSRTTPRGPHVAVGPYDDYGIAQEWSAYLRDAGLDARVHFE